MRLTTFLLSIAAAVLIAGGCTGGMLTGRKTPSYTILQEKNNTLVIKLPNRLIAIIRQMSESPVVSSQVRVETGSIYEQEYAGAGISHFLEHLLCGGSTSTRKEKETNKILARIGAQKNAATGLDSVFYYLNTTNEHVFTSIDLLSDWMLNSTISEKEFKREREVIQREISMGEGEPGRILWKLTQQARYTAHPARHPTIGYVDEFLQITRQQVKDFYKRMYTPNNMVFTVAGDIDPRQVAEYIAEKFSHAMARELPEIRFPLEPQPDSPRQLSGRADITRPRLRLAWPGTKLAGEYDYALDMLAEIIGRGESSRLKRTVRDNQALVNTVKAYNLSFSWGEGFFGIDAEPAGSEDSIPDALEGILEQIRKLREKKVTAAEIERAARNIASRVHRANQKVQEAASRLATDTLASGDPDYLLHYLDEIQKVTADDLQEASRRYLKPENLITVKLLPETKEHQAKTQKRRLKNENASYRQTMVELDNRRLLNKLRCSADNGPKEPAVESGDYKLFKLDNGLRLITQRSTVVPSVSMHIYFKGGLLGEEPGREGLTSAQSAMMDRGTKNYSASEFAEAVENLGASISASSGYNTSYIRGRALSEDWEKLMELLAEMLLRPTFPPEQWQKIKPRLIARIDRLDDRWNTELRKHFREAYFKNHPWSQILPGRRETMENIKVEDLQRFHKNNLNASKAVLAVTGDINPDKVLQKVRSLFAPLPAKGNVETFHEPETPPSGLRQISTAKPVTAVKMGLGPAVERSHKDYAAMRVLSTLISDFPSGWLQQSLRGETSGLAYAAWGQLVTGLVPGYFELTFNTSAENVPEALNRAAKVVKKARNEKITPEDFKRAKAKVLFEEFFTRQSNSQRASNAALSELYATGDYDGKLFARKVKQLSPADISKTARERFKRSLTILMSGEKVQEHNIDPAVISGNFTE